eukprot:EG_transcript_14556
MSAIGLIGGLAAMSASVVTHPADSLRVRMYLYGQLERTSTPTSSLVRHIWQAEGVHGFYRGVTATVLRQALFSTSRFTLDDLFQRMLGGRAELGAHWKLMSSAAAGAGAALVSCPADVVLIRMQADGSLPGPQRRGYTHAVDGIVRMCREEGLPSLYRGIRPLMARCVLATASQFTTYDVIKRALVRHRWDSDAVPTHLTAAVAAGCASAMVVSPLDVIKSRMMQSSINADGQLVKLYHSDWHCMRAMLATEGVSGFLKGLGPCFMRQCPQIIAMWLFYEQYTKVYHAVRRARGVALQPTLGGPA